ncbi:hypothetical protein HMN09_01395300 [Mycena chlorophos]|uniref:F-box domain-containing protein n=1 Tax=Mycena chlorophos TaxID=658473 RepID=A0A8H6RWZ9_MYCCL|nr:hypothetical protein HMN09_01395300 [Mycena chlorophos]
MPLRIQHLDNRVPPEIWHRCWRLCTIPELQRLCLTCRTFAAICQPLRFRRMYRHPPLREALLLRAVDGHWRSGLSWEELTDDLRRRTALLADFAASPYASSVRSWCFSRVRMVDARDETEPELAHALFDAWLESVAVFLASLGSFRRLQQLTLLGLDFDSPTWNALATLDELEELKFSSPLMDVNPGEPLRLKRIEVVQWYKRGTDYEPQEREEGVNELHMASPATLTHFSGALSRHSHSILLAFVVDGLALAQLTTLCVNFNVNPSQLALLGNILPLCPALETLDLRYGTRTPRDFTPVDYPATLRKLSAATIPKLHTLVAPPALVEVFVAGRPLRSITLTGEPSHEHWEQLKPILKQISQSSTTIATLHIEHSLSPKKTPEVLRTVTRYFPKLRELMLSFSERPDYEVLCVDLTESEDEACVSAERRRKPLPVAQVGPGDELPGYLYVSTGRVAPPPTFSQPDVESESASRALYHILQAQHLDLPPTLESLHLTANHKDHRQYTVAAEHALLLRLEKNLPQIHEFSLSGKPQWTRDHHLWTRRETVRNDPDADAGDSDSDGRGPEASDRSFEKILKYTVVSQVWKADGTRIETETPSTHDHVRI